MAKGKVKNNSSDSLAPPQPRTLRSRKRECPSDEISETDDVQATLHHQDTEGNSTAVDATLLQGQPSPLQESTMISTQQHQAAEQSCLTKEDPATEEKQAEAINFKYVTVIAFQGQEETTVANSNNGSQLEDWRVHIDNDANKGGKDKEEIPAEQCNSSPSQTCTDNALVLLPTFEEGDGSRAAALEEQLGANSQCNLGKKQETSHEERSNVYMADIKEVTKEPAARLPAKKKRRMGMCGLTEKERTHFLQTQKRGENAPERVEKQICNNTADLVAQDEIISSPPLPSSLSIPVGSVTEQTVEEIKLQSSHCDRAETEDHIADTTSDGTSTVCDPGCSKEKSCEAEGGKVPGPQTGDTKSDPSAEEEEEELSGNQEQELEGQTAMIVAEKTQEQMKDGSAVVDQRLGISFYSNPTQNEKTENQGAIEATPLQANTVTKTRDEKKEELTGDVGDGDRTEAGTSSTDTLSGGFDCGSVELCKAAVTPGGSERKDSCDPDDEPGAGPSTLNEVHPRTRDTNDPFGSGYLDYVSDSQLNTITLTEEEVMEDEEDLGSPGCHDATDLVCGLIRELSSLNRKVMATHRELENLRRSSKSSRSSIR